MPRLMASMARMRGCCPAPPLRGRKTVNMCPLAAKLASFHADLLGNGVDAMARFEQ